MDWGRWNYSVSVGVEMMKNNGHVVQQAHVDTPPTGWKERFDWICHSHTAAESKPCLYVLLVTCFWMHSEDAFVRYILGMDFIFKNEKRRILPVTEQHPCFFWLQTEKLKWASAGKCLRQHFFFLLICKRSLGCMTHVQWTSVENRTEQGINLLEQQFF